MIPSAVIMVVEVNFAFANGTPQLLSEWVFGRNRSYFNGTAIHQSCVPSTQTLSGIEIISGPAGLWLIAVDGNVPSPMCRRLGTSRHHYIQGLFWVCAQPMRDGAPLWRRLSFAGPKPRINPAMSKSHYVTVTWVLWRLISKATRLSIPQLV